MPKTWLSVEEQAARLRDRGLGIDDEHECLRFLSHVSYYRFSGYFRYWQRSPETGDNRFISGTAFSTIHDVYTTEQAVAASSFATMRWIEILLRTAFAHHYANMLHHWGRWLTTRGLPSHGTQPRHESRIAYCETSTGAKRHTSPTTVMSRARTSRASICQWHTTPFQCGSP